MKRCSHRFSGYCYFQSNFRYGHPIFRDDTGSHDGFHYKCTDAMSNICEFRDSTPREKATPKNPRSTWIECEICHGRHMSQETANTCRFYHEQWDALEKQLATLMPFKEEGSNEPWPPYKTSITDDRIWKAMVDKIIKRDGGCCTDCGISMIESDLIGTRRWVRGWSDSEEMNRLDDELYEIFMRSIKELSKFEVHHIIPRAKGGTHHPHNLRLLCSVCHRKYTNELMGDLASERRAEKEKSAIAEEIKRAEEFTRLHPPLEMFSEIECVTNGGTK